MRPRPRPLIARRHVTWLRRIAFALALIAQAVGASTAIAEGHAGRGYGAHVDGYGANSRGHYVHDEATCVACHVRSLQGAATFVPRLEVVPLEVARSLPRRGPVAPPRVELTPDNPSRAPPVPS